MRKSITFIITLLPALLISTHSINAAKFKNFQVVDKDYIMVNVLDGEVSTRDDGLGEKAFYNSHHEDNQDTVKLYAPALNTTAAQTNETWTIKSSDDPSFGGTGLNPLKCFRKTKMNGHAEKAWSGSDFKYEYTYEHWIYLKLPQPLQQGKTYTLTIGSGCNIDSTSHIFTYNIFNCPSEAIHINLVGYSTDKTIKSADLYIWMGDGGARDYSSFQNKNVYLYNVLTNDTASVGKVSFWMKKTGTDVGYYDLTGSDVWNADFSEYSTPGTYRLAIEDVGCSQDFVIADSVYHDPFMVALRGFFYMRIGQDSTGGIRPVPRRPLYIPGVSPSNTKVYLTTMHQWHEKWSSFSSGDVWDNPDAWAVFRKTGNPTNPNAKGGHSDALDWDRHLGHVCIIYDMLLPFFLTAGALTDDNCGIAESGNGIPDILDEAKNEVDFWLNLRDGQGYASGLTNPSDDNEFFQAAPTAMAAWANAANAAMLADCFRIGNHQSLKQQYLDSARAAWVYASGLTDQMLDKTLGLGDIIIQGRDLKMMAAAFLYNLTGETAFEDVVKQLSVVNSSTSELDKSNNGSGFYQVWGTAAYLLTSQPIHYTELHTNMKASIISQAKTKEANFSAKRPSRRATDEITWYFRTAQNVHRCMIAHAVTNLDSDKSLFRKALTLEADYGLGRNLLNMIQMTTASTPLEKKRSVLNAYTSGGDDGTPGMHPGHTPYMNLDDWYCDMTMGCPSRLYANAYPADFKKNWPADEGYFNTRYVWAHNEFTPQQTMRGKMALYGYLYGIDKKNFHLR